MSKKTKKKNAWHRQLEFADQFDNGDIDSATYWEGVQKIKWNEVTKSPEWKAKRAKVIGDKCETCDATEKLVLIPLKTPSYKDFCRWIKEEIKPEVLKEHPWHPGRVELEKPVPRETCPFCGTISVRYRKTTQDYACNSKKCKKSGFTQTEVIMYQKYTDEYQLALAERKWEWEVMCLPEVQTRIKNEATRLCIKGTRRIMELRKDDVTTLCNDCNYKKNKYRWSLKTNRW